MQSLLTVRVDRLAPQDRALLQAAAVIGRRFDPQTLLAVVDNAGGFDARLAAMQALDLVYPERKSGDYSFKHALVRDALYQSLLTGPRATLHLKIAKEIELRGGNRLAEVVEALAHHYSQTDRADKAFTFLAMAGSKSLGVYSLDDADQYFTAAIALLDKNPDCASDQQIAPLLVDYTLCSHLAARFKSVTEIVAQFMSRLDRLGDDPMCILVLHQYVIALHWSGLYREAERAQTKLSAMAARLNDTRSRAYALASAIQVTTVIAPNSVEIFEALSREALTAASNVDDAYLQCFVRYVVGWEEMHQGRMVKAHEAAEELIAVGRRISDPRSIGFGLQLEAWVALVSDDYVGALNFAETAMSVARTSIDRVNAMNAKCAALVLLRRSDALPMLRDFMHQCEISGWRYPLAGSDGFYGIALVLHGEIGGGIRWMEQSIARRESEGYTRVADWFRLNLSEIYLEIIAGTEKPPAKVLARNLVTLVAIMLTVQKRVSSLVGRAQQNLGFDRNGRHIGRCEMIMGLLCKAKKKRTLAVQHLTEARRIVSQSGPCPMLAKIEAALAELG